MATLSLQGENKWDAASIYDSELQKAQDQINAGLQTDIAAAQWQPLSNQELESLLTI